MPSSSNTARHDTRLGGWHLVAGSTGAGKTTYARALAEELDGVVFSIDEWMNTLFWPDCPEMNDFPWALERVRRCEVQAAGVARQIAATGIPAILDFGFTTRQQREGWIASARAAGISVELHSLELPAEIRWARVEQRNATKAETFVFPVTRAMFEDMERMWEPPSDEEGIGYTALHRVLHGTKSMGSAPESARDPKGVGAL